MTLEMQSVMARLNEPAIKKHVQCKDYRSEYSDAIVHDRLLRFFALPAATLEVKVPRNAWQMLKHQHAPRWLLRLSPVRYDATTYRWLDCYPESAPLVRSTVAKIMGTPIPMLKEEYDEDEE